MKIKVNENLTSLINFINDLDKYVSWFDIVQFAIDYNMYQELYTHHFILQKLIDEHNQQIANNTWKKPR